MADIALKVNLPRVILNKLRAELGSTFATYWDGDPIAIGISQMPALIVDWERSDNAPAPTRHDKWTHTVLVKAVVNKMEDTSTLEAGGSKGILIEVPTRKKLERMVFARREDNGEYLTDTVLGVLRRNYTMGGRESNQIANVEFGVNQRLTDGGEDAITAEAHIRLTANELQAVAGRT